MLNYRNAQATIRAVDSALRSRYAGKLDVTAVENGSSDDSVHVLERYCLGNASCRLITSSSNLGFAGGVALAWRQVTAPLVCLLNNDAVVHPEALQQLAQALDRDPRADAAGAYDLPIADAPSRRLPHRSELAGGTSGLLGANIWLPLLAPGEAFTASGVCLMLRRERFDQPFPPEFLAYYEDVLLGWRIRLRGQRTVRCPTAVVYHAGSATSAREPALRRHLAICAERNRLTTLLACWSTGSLITLLPLLALDELRRLATALAHLMSGKPGELVVWLVARLRLAAWLGFVLRLRGRVQRERRVPDAAYIPLMSGRLTVRSGLLGELLNGLALRYCALVGFNTVERASRRSAHASAVQV